MAKKIDFKNEIISNFEGRVPLDCQSHGIPSRSTHRPLPRHQIAVKSDNPQKTWWTDRRADVQTYESTDGRQALLGRVSQPKNSSVVIPDATASTTTESSPALGGDGFPLRVRAPSTKNSRNSPFLSDCSMYCK